MGQGAARSPDSGKRLGGGADCRRHEV